ncbi:TPA: hypothetical protein JTN94_002388 [Escherichia coli]|nr:hypothetical protein [Escherichia coli]HAX7471413.1 hypothetical protein [Escherichia coli]
MPPPKIIATMFLLIPLTSFSQENVHVLSQDNHHEEVKHVSSVMNEMPSLKLQQKHAGVIHQTATNYADTSALIKKFFIFKPIDEYSIQTPAEKLTELNFSAQRN